MTKTIMMFLAFLLVLPILPWLPLSISLKGKLIIAVESFAIAAIAVLLAPFLPVWQNALLIFLFCAVAGYFTLKYGLPGWSKEYAHEEEGSFEEKAAVMALPKKRPAFSSLMPGRKFKQGIHTSEEEKQQSDPVFFGQAEEKTAASQTVVDPPASSSEKAQMSAQEKRSSFTKDEDEEELTELLFEKPVAEEVSKEKKQAHELDSLWEEELPEVSVEQTDEQKTNNKKEFSDPQPENSSVDFLLEDDELTSSLPEKNRDEELEADDYELELLFAEEASANEQTAQPDDQTNSHSKKNEELTDLSLYSAEEDSGENLISTVLEEDALAEIAPEKTASAEESELEIDIDFEESAQTTATVQSEEKQKTEFEDLEELDLNWIDSEEESDEKSLSELKLNFDETEVASSYLEATEEIEFEIEEISEMNVVESAEELEEGLDKLNFNELAQSELASVASDEETTEESELKERLELDANENTEETEEILYELDLEELTEPDLASVLSSEDAKAEMKLEELLELDAAESTEEIEEMLYELDFEELADSETTTAAFDKKKKEEVELKELRESNAGESAKETEEMLNELDFEVPANDSSAEEPVPFNLDEFVFEKESSQETNEKELFEDTAFGLKENNSIEHEELAEIGSENLSFNEESSKTAPADLNEAENEIEGALEELAQLHLEELASDKETFEELKVSETIGRDFEKETKQDSKAITAEEKSEKEIPEINEEFSKEAQNFILPELVHEKNSAEKALETVDQQENVNATSLTEVAADKNQNLISAVLKEEALAEPVADEASSLNKQSGEQNGAPAEFKEANQLVTKSAVKEKVRLSSDWLNLITKEISVKQAMLPFEEAEQTILRYLNAPLHERDYYVIARMLLVFYMGQGEKQKAELLAEKLIQQYKEYPLLIEELKIMQTMLQN